MLVFGRSILAQRPTRVAGHHMKPRFERTRSVKWSRSNRPAVALPRCKRMVVSLVGVIQRCPKIWPINWLIPTIQLLLSNHHHMLLQRWGRMELSKLGGTETMVERLGYVMTWFLSHLVKLLQVHQERLPKAPNFQVNWHMTRCFFMAHFNSLCNISWNLQLACTKSSGFSSPKDCSKVAKQLVDVRQIQASAGAFAVLRGDARVVTWGNAEYGGQGPVSW